MFKSRARAIIIPQAEHARFAGVLAHLWGNEFFDSPHIPHASFVTGVTFHDRGYEMLDNASIKEIDKDTWLEFQKRGALPQFTDIHADLVVRFHVRRLLLTHATPDREALAGEIGKQIDSSLATHRLTAAAFAWTDHITHLCDALSFDFCFEERKKNLLAVHLKWGSDELVDVQYEICDSGEIIISPWPLCVEKYQGFLIGYELEGYPTRQEPVHVPFLLHP